jgi:hypothetical protein
MLDDRRIPDPDPNLYPLLFLMDPDPGGPKIHGSGSGTLCFRRLVWQIQQMYCINYVGLDDIIPQLPSILW